MSTATGVDHQHRAHKAEEIVRHEGTPYAKHGKPPSGVGGDSGSIAKASHHHARHKSVSTTFSETLISVTEEEQTAFLGIYGTIATKTILEVVTQHQSTLEGHSIVVKDVHPFSFAAFVLGNPQLKEYLVIIRDAWDYDRAAWVRKPLILAAESTAGRNPWRETLEGFEAKVGSHKTTKTLALEAFLVQLKSKIDQDTIRGFIDNNEFRAILNYILDAEIA